MSLLKRHVCCMSKPTKHGAHGPSNRNSAMKNNLSFQSPEQEDLKIDAKTQALIHREVQRILEAFTNPAPQLQLIGPQDETPVPMMVKAPEARAMPSTPAKQAPTARTAPPVQGQRPIPKPTPPAPQAYEEDEDSYSFDGEDREERQELIAPPPVLKQGFKNGRPPSIREVRGRYFHDPHVKKAITVVIDREILDEWRENCIAREEMYSHAVERLMRQELGHKK